MSPRPKVTIRPARIHVWDDGLRTTLVRTLGFRWRCSCGEFGRIRATPAEARGEAKQHAEGHA